MRLRIDKQFLRSEEWDVRLSVYTMVAERQGPMRSVCFSVNMGNVHESMSRVLANATITFTHSAVWVGGEA